MQIQFACNIDIDIKSPELNEINKNNSLILKEITQQFYQNILVEFADHYIASTAYYPYNARDNSSFKQRKPSAHKLEHRITLP